MKKAIYSILTALLISACGGTETPTNQSIALPDVTLDASTPDRRVVYGPDISTLSATGLTAWTPRSLCVRSW